MTETQKKSMKEVESMARECGTEVSTYPHHAHEAIYISTYDDSPLPASLEARLEEAGYRWSGGVEWWMPELVK